MIVATIDLPAIALTVAQVIIAVHVARNHQMTKEAIIESPTHGFHSNWRVFGLGLACAACSFILAFLGIMAMAMLGLGRF